MAEYYTQRYPQIPIRSLHESTGLPFELLHRSFIRPHTPFQAGYGSPPPNSVPVYPSYGGGATAGFGAPPVTGRMGEQGGLRTGGLAALGTEGYDGEPHYWGNWCELPDI